MKILICGANGQLGRAIQNECAIRGINVIPTDYPLGDNRTLHPFPSGLGNLDITKFPELKSFFLENPCDAIINCAAYNDVDEAERESEAAFLVNGFGAKNLAIMANQIQIPLVHFSTDYVFDGKKSSPYHVWDKPNPLSKYGESKLYGEELVARYTNRYFLVRLSWVFGDGRTNFVKKVLEWSKDKEELKIVEDQVSSPSYTVDLASAILDLTATGEYGTYHLSNTGYCSRYEWSAHILKQTGWKGRLIPVKSAEFPTAAKRPFYSALSDYETKRVLGYGLPDWKDATQRFLKQYRERVEEFR